MKQPLAIATWAILLVVAFATVREIQAATYFVATNGNDANTGVTATSAWKTVTHAVSAVNSAQRHTIQIGSGEYKEWLNITSSLTLVGSDTFTGTNARFSRHTSRTIIRPPSVSVQSALVNIATTNVWINNLTLIGDYDTNGTPDAKVGVYSMYRPTVVQYCSISNFAGYGVLLDSFFPPSVTNDTDFLRCYVLDNKIEAITHSNTTSAAAIMLNHAPGSYNGNDIRSVTGRACKAGIFMESCFYNLAMTNRLSVSDNALDNCALAIWLNKFAEPSEQVDVFRNRITNAVVGIRITACKGQATVSNNIIAMGGISPNPSNPIYSRGLWIHADERPWTTNNGFLTDHQVLGNVITAIPSGRTNSRGMLFEYSTTTTTNQNNGVRATLYANTVRGCDHGLWVESGSFQVSIPHDPLVEVVSRMNLFVANKTNAMIAVGLTNQADAVSNWWGSATGPPATSNKATGLINYTPWLGYGPADSDADNLLDLLDDDDDNDTALDWEEAVAGTNPSNDLSVFECDTTLTTNGVVVKWSSVGGKTYRLHRRATLSAGNWQFITTQIATPPTNSYPDPAGTTATSYFYKVTVTN